jgi:hypothetical protein
MAEMMKAVYWYVNDVINGNGGEVIGNEKLMKYSKKLEAWHRRKSKEAA